MCTERSLEKEIPGGGCFQFLCSVTGFFALLRILFVTSTVAVGEGLSCYCSLQATAQTMH